MQRFIKTAVVMFFILIPLITFAQDENEEEIKVKWQSGPGVAEIGKIAEIKIPKEYHFADGDDTKKIMEFYGNHVTDRELGYFAPVSEEWFMIFEFDDSGYVKDDEKDDLNADDILKSITDGNKAQNKWRKENNMPELIVTGWYKKPAYDSETNNLEWATKYTAGDHNGINYNIRYLGRKGVMEVTIVAGEENLEQVIAEAKNQLKSYSFTSGNRYAEFVKGDKMAEYGLAALVGGGAFAVAAKTGLLQKFWKLIVIAIAAVGGFLKKLFSGRGRKNNERSYTPPSEKTDNE